ncbi:hypothetical protein HanIR_Chr15g0756991 [Helianthus annuus]|nr:hypothetical protein HanIR_Chr15g0756991 [Helianthus annuus]
MMDRNFIFISRHYNAKKVMSINKTYSTNKGMSSACMWKTCFKTTCSLLLK